MKTTHLLSDYQAKYFAHELQRSFANDHVGKLAGLLFDAQVEPKPHQIDAALFALKTPFLPGGILADEVGLGKTIEAGIVISQYWAERRRSILIVAPSSLRQQWQQELYEKFLIPSSILDLKSKDSLLGAAGGRSAQVLIFSYEFALRHETSLLKAWDLVVADEAHRLRNYWTGKTKAAEAVAHIVKGAHKTVLLTATPLQNKLEELYGLVSIFDSGYFYSLDAFRERYVKNRDLDGDDDLVERVATVSKRTLRRDADKYIHFTKRLPLTVEFTPSPDEARLYDLVNDYLQRDELFAFAGSQRHLSALIIRKRLGSSTYAVAGTMENIANRLADEVAAGQRRDGRGGLVAADFAVYDEITSEELEEADEIDGAGTDARASSVPLNESLLKAMRAEVAELREYAALARSITENQKAVKLGEALDLGFGRLRELGAPEKAIIFTDSTKTQEYIARSLREAGRGEGLVLFNGSNTGPDQTAIYQAWLEKNKDGDLITGIATVDRRKALVDYFRTEGTIMIATEAAAEGINLQFCSMLVNYDLPWNPQRVEQRIGRVHRFGQKHNVVVVNFSNKGNIAEQRILELLTNKFQLFSSVFGASDEVLGAIEDGLDFEKTISDILTRCRTAEELDSTFKELEEQYAGEISREMASARAKVFDNLDPHVQDRLKAYDTQSGEVLNKFERLLLAVTRHELDEYATFEGDGRTFVLNESPVKDAPTGRYFFKSQPLNNAHQYRYASPLAQHVIEASKTHDTPARELTFSLGRSKRVSSAIRALEGASGELTVSVATFRMKARDEDISESYMLAGALTDDGHWLDEEYVADILDLACIDVGTGHVAIDESRFTPHLDTRRAELEKEVQGRNSRYYDQQEELLYRNQQDRKADHEGKIREYRTKEKEARRLARQADDPMEQLRLKKEARKWEQRAEEADEDLRDARKKLRAEADKFLELIEQSLQGTQQTAHLFTIRWRIATQATGHSQTRNKLSKSRKRITRMTDEIYETSSTTPNFQTELAAQLANLIPEAIADGKVDVEKLKELLDGDEADSGERFGLFWPGKKRALRAAQEPTAATLKPDFDNSKDWDTTQNVFIEGDNLEVLKILQKHYHAKIKMIYIDPPYNTGKDFVYPDNYKEGLDTYLEWTRQVNEEGKKVTTNAETEGRYHSNWLNMMYPRLKLARNLLTDDGVIFISIDDNEYDNLVKVCNEVFGEANHVATFIWKSKSGGANDSGEVAVDHEYIVCFARSNSDNALGLDPDAVATTSYNNEDEHGKFALERLDKQNLQYSRSMDYDLIGPDGQIYKLSHRDPARPNAIWRWSKGKVQSNMDQLVFKEGNVYTKNYQKPGGKPRSLFIDDRFGRTRTGSAEVRELLNGSYFDNPKPTKLLNALVAIGASPDSIVLDFFAGSGSTAHSVLAMNAKDGGNRRFIAVQLPEPTGTDAKRAGFSTIADVSRERIAAAGEQIQSELSDRTLDIGFRSYELSDTNFAKWRLSSDVEPGVLQQHLLGLRDSATDDATADELLAEILLKQGYSLAEAVSPAQIDGLDVRLVRDRDGDTAVVAYLNEHVKPTLEQLRALVDESPTRIIVLEDALQGDDELKTNLSQLAKSKGIELWTA